MVNGAGEEKGTSAALLDTVLLRSLPLTGAELL